MSVKSATGSQVLGVSARWQLAFVGVVIVGWLAQVAALAHFFMSDGYISSGTWTFQITMWLFPVLLFAGAFWLLCHYRAGLQRVFMATLAAVIGLSASSAVSLWENKVWSAYLTDHPISASDTSWWSAYGNEWVVMAVCLAVYLVTLFAATRRPRR